MIDRYNYLYLNSLWNTIDSDIIISKGDFTLIMLINFEQDLMDSLNVMKLICEWSVELFILKQSAKHYWQWYHYFERERYITLILLINFDGSRLIISSTVLCIPINLY